MFDEERVVDPHEILELFAERVTQNMNETLTKPFSASEISDALFQISPFKAPSPDGFPARFYQRNWEVLKEDVTRGALSFFESSSLPVGINDTVLFSSLKEEILNR